MFLVINFITVLFYKSSYLRENMDYFKAFSKRKWMTFILIYDSIDFVMCFDELVYSNLKKKILEWDLLKKGKVTISTYKVLAKLTKHISSKVYMVARIIPIKPFKFI